MAKEIKDEVRPEAKVKADLRAWWNKHPQSILLIPYCQPCHTGCHDYIGIVDSRPVTVEVKKGDQRIGYSEGQEAFRKKWEEHNGLSFLIHSVEECKAKFSEAGLKII